MTGGWKNSRVTNQARVIDVSSQEGTVNRLPPMLQYRCIHATAVVSNFVFAFGGLNERNELLSSCEFYDPATNT